MHPPARHPHARLAFCTQLKQAWAALEKLAPDARRDWIDAFVLPQKGGARGERKIFTEEEEETLVTYCNIALEGSFGVSKEFVHGLMCDILKRASPRERAHAKVAKSATVTMETVKSWMRAHGVKRYKSNSIDPARVAKATAHVRDAWFARVDRCAAALAGPPHLQDILSCSHC